MRLAIQIDLPLIPRAALRYVPYSLSTALGAVCTGIRCCCQLYRQPRLEQFCYRAMAMICHAVGLLEKCTVGVGYSRLN